MPTNFNNTSAYAGEFAGKYIGAALLSANTIENGGVTVMPNVKYRSTVKALTTQTDFIKNDSCDFDPTGDVVLGDRVIEPKYLQINATVCRKEFEDDWEAIQMGYSAFDTLPKNFTDFFIARLLGSMAESTEISLWSGDGANNGEFDGLFFTALGEAGTGIPVGQCVGGTTIDSTNVLAELSKVVDALPSRLYGKEGLKIYAPQNVVRAYVRALGGFTSGIGAAGINNQGTTWYNGNANALTFDGIPLFMANGMSSNTMLASTKENLFFGTGLLSDHQECRIIDMSPVDGSKNVRFVARYTAGTQIGILEDCVIYDVSL